MRIWRCLCFIFDDDEVQGPDSKTTNSGAMIESALEDDSNPITMEDAEEAVQTFCSPNRETDDRMFEEMIRVVQGRDATVGEAAGDGVAVPVALRRSTLRFAQRLRGESSSSSMTELPDDDGIEDSDRDLHNKRAKVFTASRDCDYATMMPSSTSLSSSSGPKDMNFSRNPDRGEIIYHNFMWNDSSDDGCFASNGNGGDGNGDETPPSKSDDLEVRMDLSDDLLHMVFSFMDHVDLCRAAMVCKQWRIASAHEEFWRCLNFENRNVSVEQFEDMCRRYPNATEVNLHGAPSIYYLVMKAVSSLRNLETLALGRGQLGDSFFHALTDCNMLRSLNVNDATLGNGMQEISISHDRLQHLQLVKCRVLRISVRCPELQNLSLKRSNMGQAVLNCPLLRVLDIGSCHKLSDAAIRSAAISCPQLESLDMSNCSCVSDETLREIAGTCANLHILDASYCPNISLESVRLPMLTELRLHSCEGITSASMAAISLSSMLEVLELNNCNLLTTVSLDLPRLQSISLVHCRKFVDLSLRSATLSSIVVSNCPSLHRISITSNSLKKLALLRQENLATLVLECQCLQEVDLTDCESLTNSICEVFSDGGGCPMLRSLILDNCESLTAVRFCSTSLLSLSLVGCRALTFLDLICPCLEKVCLDGCDHLENASFWPVSLRSLNLGICPKLNTLRIEAQSMLSLELKGCGVLSDASINCPCLTSLDASFCSQLKDDCLSATAASCPLIESLILMSCPSVGSDGLYSLSRLHHLTVLDLSYTFLMNLQPVFESCLQLKVLQLQACKYLTDNSLEPLYKEGALPMLQELDLSYGTLCQSAIEDLLACCTHLTHLSLNGCVNMHDLNWGSNSGQVDELSTIQYSSASFSHEENHILKLRCPRLTSLFLQSCSINEEAVEAAISECNMLETLDVRFCPKIFSISMGRLRAACPSVKRVFSSLLSAS
ncbi:F-box/LRR-repeat protein 15 [Linum perenne]